ncbi:hypothetical protein FCM35_KLT11441 [Carex littledalei]|uniref:Uncharacterized protein n=1 Tax=Carex littledalei TaxID=544730 RepID=A0A833QR85_9POAL|nr:hypothetical protein FCM35_KLT11441 [Carex littledalei]
MSGLIDIWSAEMARRREKNGVVLSSNNPGSIEDETRPNKAQVVSSLSGTFLDRVLKSNSFEPATLDSEIALSVLVDCFGQ